MTIPFTDLVRRLPATTPFVGPETLERQRGKAFDARIGANESAFGISPKAAEAMITAIGQSGCSWYGDPENFELRSALAKKHGVTIEEVCVDGGIDSLLGLTVRMLVEPGNAVVTSQGAYPTFIYHVNGFGGTLNTVPYKDNHEDPQALLAKATECSARLIYFSNPDNPMGTSHTADVVQQMINELPDGSTLVLDEAYTEFAKNDLAPVIDTNNTQVLRYRTFSKAYGMAGMRIGYVIAHPELITGLNKIRNHFAITKLAQMGALAAVNDTDFLNTVRQQVTHGRQRVYDLAESLGLTTLESSTNFVSVDLGSGDRTRQILKSLNESGIFIRMPGVVPLDRYIRVGVGTENEHAIFAEKFSQLVKA